MKKIISALSVAFLALNLMAQLFMMTIFEAAIIERALNSDLGKFELSILYSINTILFIFDKIYELRIQNK